MPSSFKGSTWILVLLSPEHLVVCCLSLPRGSSLSFCTPPSSFPTFRPTKLLHLILRLTLPSDPLGITAGGYNRVRQLQKDGMPLC
ncbi:hypothetical protein BC826DRAFT_1059123 [Russula brevipes]|nr:hypothetical protein BC826DRAFT_1059123 [Russula brevipes]